MRLRLAIQSGPDSGRNFPLDHDVLTIGTTDLNDIIIDDQRASRRHAELRLVDDHWLVADLGSLAGTYVNGERIAFPRALRPGDLIGLGETTLMLEHGDVTAPYGEPLALRSETAGTALPSTGISWRPDADQDGHGSHRHDRLFVTATATGSRTTEATLSLVEDDPDEEPALPATDKSATTLDTERAAAPTPPAGSVRGLEETIELSHRLLREAWRGEFERLAGEKDELETRVYALGAELQQMSDQLSELKGHLDRVLRELVTRHR